MEGQIEIEREIKIFDENFNTVKIKENANEHRSRKNPESTATEPIKRRKRAKTFIKKSKERVDARYNRRQGVIKSIRDLKIVTNDEAYIEFHKVDQDGTVRPHLFLQLHQYCLLPHFQHRTWFHQAWLISHIQKRIYELLIKYNLLLPSSIL